MSGFGWRGARALRGGGLSGAEARVPRGGDLSGAGVRALLSDGGPAREDRPSRNDAPPRPDSRPRGATGPLSAWLELLRVSALVTVPGDALAGAAALSVRPHRGTFLAAAASLCLYEAGMALNDWADRAEDAVDRPHRPIPSGRIAPGAALTAACALTAAGLTLAGRAGRPTLGVAALLTATVWSYDLKLKHTPAGPAAMAAARSLDVLMGAVATARADRAPEHRPAQTWRPAPATAPLAVVRTALVAAAPSAAMLGAHTYAVTEVSRHETQGGSSTAPLAALATTAAVVAAGAFAPGSAMRPAQGAGVSSARRVVALPFGRLGGSPFEPPTAHPAPRTWPTSPVASTSPVSVTPLVAAGLAAVYLRTAGKPLVHAVLNPSPPLTQRAVGGGIRAMIPLQAALIARSGAPGAGAALLLLAPLARRLARKVSPT
ncbi:SCO3242 family prenyltransferase [Streptomyces sp. NPDC058657]|uniref:SCO3242 family prenyltransferase n=1 Tax=unclassified Streptomyces TaxID=2593676 RepID=UPI003661B585